VKRMVASMWRDDGGGYPLAILLFHKSNIRLCKNPLFFLCIFSLCLRFLEPLLINITATKHR
jgi:hypothetical protein